MRITLNITPAIRETTGIGTYAMELTKALLGLDRDNRYTLFFSKNPFDHNERISKDFIKGAKANSVPISLPYRFLNFLWNKLNLLPVEHLCGKCDIFHSLDMLSPIVSKAKLLTTIHDINWLISDDSSRLRKKALYEDVSKSLKRSGIIIAVSNFTKKELLKYFPFLKADKIEVVYSGVSEAFRPLDAPSVEYYKKRYEWGDFILYIGVLDQSRKNLIRLVQAYSYLKSKKFITEKLVLCGRLSRNSRELLRLIDRSRLSEDVIVYNKWIPDSEMPVIYNMAKTLIYPSLYEGFGFPILEAMACGRPVITSQLSSMPEVGGEACLYIDPYDLDSLANGMLKVLKDEALREDLSIRGLNHVKKFTWQNTAEMTIRLYKKILCG